VRLPAQSDRLILVRPAPGGRNVASVIAGESPPRTRTRVSPESEVVPSARLWAGHPFVECPDFRRLFIGDVLVKVAERYFALTFVWWLLAGPHADRSGLGILLTIESLPILAVGLLVGPLIDRLNKKRCMVVSTVIQAGVVAAVAALVSSDALSFPRLCVAAVLIAAMIPVFESSAAAALPQSVTDTRLPAAAALQSMAVEFSNVIAASLSAIVLSVFGFAVAAGVNAALYLAAGLFLLRLPTAAFAGRRGRRSYIADLRAGLAYIVKHRSLASFVAIYVGELFLIVPLLVLIPMLVQAVLGGVVGWVAILETTFSVGAIVTAIGLSLGDARRRLYRRATVAAALLGLSMFGLAAIRNPYAMIPDIALMGACVAMLMGLSNVFFQQVIPDEMKGRFFGVVETLAAAVTPLGYAAVGLAFGSAGVRGVLIATGSGLALLCVLLLLSPRVAVRRVRRFAADGLSGGAL
jgi:MFS transporter, DHA3 family, macrolide efflux protein